LFCLAFVARVAAIGALFLVSAHDSQGAGYLFGDEAYSLARSWRMRNMVLGIPQLKFDYHGRVGGLRSQQLSLGDDVSAGARRPAPYGLRVLNAALFLARCCCCSG